MSAVSGGGNYISDGALLAWATSQQNRLYGDLHDTMEQQELHGQMASDLADLKLHLQGLAKHPENIKDVEAELQTFLHKYGSNPQFDEITATLTEIDKSLIAQMPTDKPTASSSVTGHGAGAYYQVGSHVPSAHGAAISHSKPKHLDQEQIKDWSDALDKKLGDAGTNEQLGMVHINEIKSTIDQATQLTSQMIKSSNDSMSSVIHNIV